MARTFNQELFDAMVRHQIALLQFSGSVRNKVWALLDATEERLKEQIRIHATRSGFETPARKRRLALLLGNLRKTRINGWAKARKEWFKSMRELARAEPGFFDKIMAVSFPVELGATLPTAAALRNIVTAQPYYGRTLSEWAANVEKADLDRIAQAVRLGIVQGEGPTAIARRVVGTKALSGRNGVTQTTRRQSAVLIRTITNGIAAQARELWAKQNSHLSDMELFVATLDDRTTPVCRRHDGKRFKVGKPPFLPIHMGERSLRILVLDGEVVGERPRRDFTQRQLLREFARQEGFPAVKRRSLLPRGTKGRFDAFARRRMRELTGTTPAKVSYGAWLRTQTAAQQDDILGATRGILFRRGGLTMDDFTLFNGTELTLSELASRHTEAFLRAGLDPAAFR